MAANTRIFESTESSSPIVTRAVAAGLRREYCETYQFDPWQRAALQALGRLPQGVARFLIPRLQSVSGLPPSLLDGLSVDRLAADRLQDFAGLRGPFPSITIGAALGGASTHLALALGGLFLPQAFVITIKGGSKDGDAETYFRRSADLASAVAQRNPGVLAIQHYDPVHDGWVTRTANHLRLKLLDLPAAYIDTIRRNLEPGGAVCYLDCGARWLRYRIGERHTFQVGGWGGIPAREFLEGSPRLRHYCSAAGLRHCVWSLPGYPLETGPESEWGSEPAFAEALESFCRREGYRFIPISLGEPSDFSRLAFQAVAELLKAEGRQPAGVLIEMFTQFNATAVRESGLLPLWLVFNTRDSLAFLQEMLPLFPKDRPVFFSPLATFSLTPDLVSWSEWEHTLRGSKWINVGARASHYPADALALTRWIDSLRVWVNEHVQPIRTCMSAEALRDLAKETAQQNRL